MRLFKRTAHKITDKTSVALAAGRILVKAVPAAEDQGQIPYGLQLLTIQDALIASPKITPKRTVERRSLTENAPTVAKQITKKLTTAHSKGRTRRKENLERSVAIVPYGAIMKTNVP